VATSLQFRGEREPNIEEGIPHKKGVAAMSEEALMKTLMHLKGHGNSNFHLHPQHALFSLVASFVLAVLVVLILVSSAR
jgi:hypothetical protein